MNIFELEIWYDEGNICTFYTVRVSEDGSMSETDMFFETFAISGNQYEDQALQLFR